MSHFVLVAGEPIKEAVVQHGMYLLIKLFSFQIKVEYLHSTLPLQPPTVILECPSVHPS